MQKLMETEQKAPPQLSSTTPEPSTGFRDLEAEEAKVFDNLMPKLAAKYGLKMPPEA